MRATTFLVLLGVCGLACGLGACGKTQNQAIETELTAKVEQGDLAIEIELTGSFIAEEKDEIRMEPSAYRGDLIITKLVAEGRSVKKGDVLIEFDPSSLEDALEEATDDVEAKTVEVEKAESELKAWEIDQQRKAARRENEASRAGQDLAKAKELAADVLADKKKEVKDAGLGLADAKVDLEQLEGLYKERELHTATENILLERERRRIQNTERGAKKRVRGYEIWEKYDKPREIEDKQLEYDDKLAEVEKAKVKATAERKEKDAAVSKAQRAHKKAQKKVDELQTDSKSLRVTAPRDGIVFYGAMRGAGAGSFIVMGLGRGNDELKVGGRVRTHSILVTVASMERLSVSMQALESDIQYLQTGLPVIIRPDAFPALAVPGELTSVDSVASRSNFFSDVRKFKVSGKYEGTYPQLRSGMKCRASIKANSVPDCLQVPVLAVFREGEEHYCWVDSDGSRKKRLVKIGAANESRVEIKEGLRKGETVILYDPTNL